MLVTARATFIPRKGILVAHTRSTPRLGGIHSRQSTDEAGIAVSVTPLSTYQGPQAAVPMPWFGDFTFLADTPQSRVQSPPMAGGVACLKILDNIPTGVIPSIAWIEG